MFVQNGSAILVAIIAEQYFGSLGITLVSIGFTIAYFVVVEAMAKTFGILHSDSAALALAPIVYFLGRMLSLPTRGAHRARQRAAARARASSRGRSSPRRTSARWPRWGTRRAASSRTSAS